MHSIDMTVTQISPVTFAFRAPEEHELAQFSGKFITRIYRILGSYIRRTARWAIIESNR
jgi:hypothetical protein